MYRMVAAACVCGVVWVLAGCGGDEAVPSGVVPAPEAPAPAASAPGEPAPVRREVLANGGFDQWVGGVALGWLAYPAEGVAPASDGAGVTLRNGAALVQRVPGDWSGRELTASVDAAAITTGFRPAVVYEADGRDVWTYLRPDAEGRRVARVSVPAGASPDSVQFRLSLDAGAEASVQVAGASLEVLTRPDDPVGETLRNGGFTDWDNDRPEGWTLYSPDRTGQAPGLSGPAVRLDPDPDAHGAMAQVVVGDAAGRPAVLSAFFQDFDPDQHVLALRYTQGGESRYVYGRPVASGDWTLVEVRTQIPSDADPGSVQYRLGVRPGAATPAVVDHASLRLFP